MTTNELMFLIEEDPEGGYNAKALGQSIFVQGDTFETLKSSIKDALECHFDTKEDIPKIIIRLYDKYKKGGGNDAWKGNRNESATI